MESVIGLYLMNSKGFHINRDGLSDMQNKNLPDKEVFSLMGQPFSFYEPDPSIIFMCPSDSQVLKILPPDKATGLNRIEWSDKIERCVSLERLNKYLKDIVSPDLREALVREIKIKMDTEVLDVVEKNFNWE